MKSCLVITSLALVLISCSGTKKLSSTPKETTVASEQRNNTSNSQQNTVTASELQTGGVVNRTNGSSGAMNNVQTFGENAGSSAFDYEGMYTKLEMTDDQISSFRDSMKNFQKRRANKPNGDMMGTIEGERTKQLKNILTKQQFTAYQKWLTEIN